MTTLNRRLQLAILNRKKGRNSLEKGFTLVELMIVIVIVGILSAVALPNFLSQTSKAKGTECTSKAGAILNTTAADALGNNAKAYTAYNGGTTNALTTATTDSALCTFSSQLTTAPTAIYTMDVVGKNALASKYTAKFCVNYTNGKKDSEVKTDGSALTTITLTGC